jgi:hypothetical protein
VFPLDFAELHSGAFLPGIYLQYSDAKSGNFNQQLVKSCISGICKNLEYR